MGCAPIVLDVGGIGDVIPLPGNLSRVFGVLLGITEQEIRKVITAEIPLKLKLPSVLAKASWLFL